MSWHELEQIACCPISKNSLRILTDSELCGINRQVVSDDLFYADGTRVGTPLLGGLVTADGQYVYRADDDIATLLPEKAVALTSGQSCTPTFLDGKRQAVQEFYDAEGWRVGSSGHFKDTELFEDLRDVSVSYRLRCHRRVLSHLKPCGQYLLDVASGPVQYDAYEEYSAGYGRRVCVDVSRRALREARRKLGPKGLYAVGDISNLPFHDGVFDGVISLHTIYHVPENEQRGAFLELYRVLRPNSAAVVVYTWGGHSALGWLSLLPTRIARRARACLNSILRQGRIPSRAELRCRAEAPVYSYTHSYRWLLKEFSQAFPFDVLVWRSVSVPFLKTLIPNNFLGKYLLGMMFRLEELFPRWCGKIGQYPMIVIQKGPWGG